VPRILTNEHGGTAPTGIEGLNTPSGLNEALLVEDSVCGKEDLAMNVSDAGVGPAQGSVESGVIEAVAMHLIKSERHVQRWRSGIGVLAGQIPKELIGRDRQIPYSPLEEITGECSFRGNYQLGRLRPASHLTKEGAEPAQILLIRALVGAYLGDG
jgi:hypothetical protein